MQNLLQKWYRILENETNRKVTILIPVEQRKCKKDEENKHQKQATLVREPKINHFFVAKKLKVKTFPEKHKEQRRRWLRW